MNDLQFTSVLTADYRGDLERLLFFNPGQPRFRHDILRSIVRCGSPEIVVRNGYLHVSVGKCPDAQNIHALARERPRPCLAGSIVYFRESPENLVIAHIAVAPRFAMSLGGDDLPLAIQLLNQVILAARRVRGIESVELLYSHGRHSHIAVQGGPPVAP